MKKILFYICCMILFASCQQQMIEPQNQAETPTEQKVKHPGMSRMKFYSREQIKEAAQVVDMYKSETSRTRALAQYAELTDGSEEYISLYDENQQKAFNNFTASEWAAINNDPEELEYELTDTVIADYRFAQLLNARREIQLKDSVYRYFDNGVAVTSEENAAELDEIDNVVSNIDPVTACGTETMITPRTKFIVPDWNLVSRPQTSVDVNPEIGGDGGGGNNTGSQTPSLKHGPLKVAGIPDLDGMDVREVDYDTSGDGNWFHKLWTGIWGRNIVALNKFDKNHQLNLNFYDQNYIIYSNIGTKIKMQKKVIGIWWNIKADEMYHGWEMVCLDYTTPIPYSKFPKQSNGTPALPKTMDYNFPFKNTSDVLLYIPFTDFTFHSNNLNNAFGNALKKAWDALEGWVKSSYDKKHQDNNVGLFSFKDAHMYLFCGPTVNKGTKKRSMESKFYAQFFPGTYQIGFSFGLDGNFSFNKIHIDGDDHVCIDSGLVYGAIKYKNQWRGARIYKLHKN